MYNGAGQQTVTYAYDAAGSFSEKSDYAAAYHYLSGRPHVLESVDLVAGGSMLFDHDENGNVIGRIGGGRDETITYDAFNKPIAITNNTTQVSSTFTYGADLMRYRQTTPQNTTLYYVDKLMEIEASSSNVDYRHYLGEVAILTKTGDLNDPSPGIKYLHRDRLGSVATITDEFGFVAEGRGYDAFGKPRAGNWADKTPATQDSNITDRGFTDHEHLDDWQLVHMNGRVFDYNLGRFYEMDPIIQAPGNGQSVNPYSYIMNNPLSGTDPSGYVSQDTMVGDIEDGVHDITDAGGNVVGTIGINDGVVAVTRATGSEGLGNVAVGMLSTKGASRQKLLGNGAITAGMAGNSAGKDGSGSSMDIGSQSAANSTEASSASSRPAEWATFTYAKNGKLRKHEDSHDVFLASSNLEIAQGSRVAGNDSLTFFALMFGAFSSANEGSLARVGITRKSLQLKSYSPTESGRVFQGNQNMIGARTASVAKIARFAGVAGNYISLYADRSAWKNGQLETDEYTVNSAVTLVATLAPRIAGWFGLIWTAQSSRWGNDQTSLNELVGGYMYRGAMAISPNIEVPIR